MISPNTKNYVEKSSPFVLLKKSIYKGTVNVLVVKSRVKYSLHWFFKDIKESKLLTYILISVINVLVRNWHLLTSSYSLQDLENH